MILQKMRVDAEAKLGERITQAVITVPAYFNDAQRQATKDPGGLSKDEVDRMVREAQQHAQEDRQRREEIETRNRADSLAYQAERTLKDLGEKISASLRSEIEDKIKSVRDALSGTDITSVHRATDELEQSMQRVGQEVYSQPEATTGAGTISSSEPGTAEGEFHEV